MIVEPDSHSPPEKPKRRALPARIIDSIRDGATPEEIQRRGDYAVWDRLVSTAASAHQRGWSRTEWAGLVTHGASLLGVQLCRKHDTEPPKQRSATDSERTLVKAWDAAAKWLTEAPPAHNKATALARVEKIAEAAARAAMDDADRAVLGHAINEARRIGTDRPAMARRSIMAATGLGERMTRTSVDHLVAAGWLTVEDPGMPGALRKRAALYRLGVPMPGTLPLIPRGDRSVGRPTICGTPDRTDEANPKYGLAKVALPENVIQFPPRFGM